MYAHELTYSAILATHTMLQCMVALFVLFSLYKYHHGLFNSFNHCIHSCSSVWQALVTISFSAFSPFHWSVYGQDYLVWISNCWKGLCKKAVTKTWNELFYSVLFQILHTGTIQYPSLEPRMCDLGIPNPKPKLLLITGNYGAFCSVLFQI